MSEINSTLFITEVVNQFLNPECSYLSGWILGSLNTLSFCVYLACLYILMKLVDKLILEPIIQYIKNKFKVKK